MNWLLVTSTMVPAMRTRPRAIFESNGRRIRIAQGGAVREFETERDPLHELEEFAAHMGTAPGAAASLSLVEIVKSPPSGIAWIALAVRFRRTCITAGVAIGIGDVAGVPAPVGGDRRLDHAGTGGASLLDDGVDLGR